jgi:low temperature requirement protein LtrA
VLVSGATFAQTLWTPSSVAAVFVAFVGSLAMWWIYFDKGVEIGSEKISHAADPGRLGRLAYTYLHLPIVAGIIVTAVANALLLEAPAGALRTRAIASFVGGPLAYLTGALLFKRAVRGWFQLSHLVGIGLLVAMLPLALVLAGRASPLALASACTVILVVVALWESLSLRTKNEGAVLRA